LWTVPAAGGSPRQLVSEAGDYGGETIPVWPRPSVIAYQRSGNANYSLVDPATGQERPLLTDDHGGKVYSPKWSPDGAWVAVYRKRSDFRGLRIVSTDGNTGRAGAGHVSTRRLVRRRPMDLRLPVR
jgi:dipeptidyl aminopeptidase/acylaminoacyl peptidase